jgi:hypothetical protein
MPARTWIGPASSRADEVIAIDAAQWRQRQRGEYPYWRGICGDVIWLDAPLGFGFPTTPGVEA